MGAETSRFVFLHTNDGPYYSGQLRVGESYVATKFTKFPIENTLKVVITNDTDGFLLNQNGELFTYKDGGVAELIATNVVDVQQYRSTTVYLTNENELICIGTRHKINLDLEPGEKVISIDSWYHEGSAFITNYGRVFYISSSINKFVKLEVEGLRFISAKCGKFHLVLLADNGDMYIYYYTLEFVTHGVTGIWSGMHSIFFTNDDGTYHIGNMKTNKIERFCEKIADMVCIINTYVFITHDGDAYGIGSNSYHCLGLDENVDQVDCLTKLSVEGVCTMPTRSRFKKTKSARY